MQCETDLLVCVAEWLNVDLTIVDWKVNNTNEVVIVLDVM